MSDAIANLSPLHDRLRSVWRKRSRVGGGVGAAAVVATLASLIALGVAIDWMSNLPAWARTVMLAAFVTVLAVVAQRTWWRHRRPYRAVAVALEVEKLDPSLAGLVVSGVQLAPNASGVSSELIAHVQRDAEQRSSRLDFTQVVQTSPLRRAAVIACAGVAVVAGLVLWQPVVMRTFAQRLLMPWSDATYPTRTKLAGFSGDLIIRTGEPVELFAIAAGEVPESGTLHIRMLGAGWESLTLSRSEGGRFAYTLPKATTPLEYSFDIGDARSQRFNVDVATPPRVAKALIRLDHPPYTKLAPMTVETFNLKLPEGTKATWDLSLDRAAISAELLADDQAPVSMKLNDAGTRATLELAPAASASYVLRFTWKLGEKTYTDESPRHYIQLVPDADPIAVLVLPAEDTKATLDKQLEIKFTATDDYALGEATLVYQLNDGTEQRRAIGNLGGVTTSEQQQSWNVRQDLKDLKMGDILTVSVEVSDHRTGAGKIGRTQIRRIQFVSDAEYLAYVTGRHRRYLQQLRPLYSHELESSAALRQMTSPTTRKAQP